VYPSNILAQMCYVIVTFQLKMCKNVLNLSSALLDLYLYWLSTNVKTLLPNKNKLTTLHLA